MKFTLQILLFYFITFSSYAQTFSPNSISGLSFWFSADSVSIPNVNTWYDKSGNNNNAVQTDPSKYPVIFLSDSTINNQPYIYFDGIDKFLEVPDANSLDFTDKFTIIIIAKQKPNFGLNTFLSKWDYPTQGSWAIEASPGTSSITSYIANSLIDIGGNNITFNNVNFSDNQYRIFTFIFNGVDSQNKLQLKVNSTTIPAQISGAITSVLMNSAASLKIGAFGGLPRFFNGNMAEILGYNNILNDSQLDSVYKYLQNKYAPPVNLGSDININYGFCPDTLHAGTRFKHFQWYKNGIELPADTFEALVVSSSGLYKITVSDIFDFISSDSIYVNYPDSYLNISDTTICLGDSIEVTNSLSALNGYSFLWSSGSSSPSIYISSSDTINLTIQDTINCSIVTNTAIISIDSLKNKIHLGADIDLCSGNTISLIYYPENPNFLNFVWTGNINDSILTVIDSGNYWVSVTNNRGCVGIDTIYVNIVGSAPVVSFMADTACYGIPTNFLIIPSISVDSLLWDFGDNSNDTSILASHIYENPDTFFVTLTVYDSICYNTVSKSVIVKSIPQADFTYTSSCVGFPVVFTNTSNTLEAGTITNYFWNFANLMNSTEINPEFTFPSTGNQNVSLTITASNQCKDSISYFVTTVSTAPIPEISLVLPSNNSFISNYSISFNWSAANSAFFIIQLSFDNTFSSVIFTDTTNLTQFSKHFDFSNNQIVYWRVKAYNYCYQESISAIYSFTFFNPSDISGMSFWFSADSVSLNNNIVDTLFDKSGNNNNAFQSEAALRPSQIISDSSINNNPVIHFDGNGKFLEVLDTNTLDFSDQFTIFFISSQANTAGYPTYLCKWDHPTQGSWAIMSSPTPSEIITTIAPSLTGGGDDNFTTINSNIIPDQYKLFSFQFNGNLENANRLKVNINSNDINTIVNGNIVTELINSSANLKIGTFGGLGRFFEGNIGEIIGFNHVLSDTLFNSVINYFRGKYFPPPVNLGSDINILYGFCDTIVHAGNRFTQFSWSTGETTESISVSYPGGTFTVTVTDVFGFKSTDSIIIKYPTYNQLSDTTICFGDTLFWNLNFNGQYNYIWNDGITSPIRNITLENTYQVTITDTTFQQCSIVTQPVFVKVDSFPNYVSLGPDADMCIGNTLYLQNGYNEAITYLWNNGDTNNNYIITAQDSIIAVTVTDSLGCIGIDSLIITGISGIAPIANFIYQGICLGDTTFFADLSSGNNINSWLWNFNNEASSADSSTFNIFSVAGLFPVKLTITTTDGCFNTVIKNINIHNLPTPMFYSTNNCTNNFTNFINSTISDDSVTLWNWSFGDNITSNDSTPTHSYSEEGSYNATLIATTNFGCIDTIEKIINIKISPLTDFNYSPVCKGQPVYFADNTQNPDWYPIIFRKWDFGDNSPTTSSINPSHTFNTIDTFIVKYITTSINGCSDTSNKALIVTMPPTAEFTGLEACVNSNHQLLDASTSTIPLTQWKWKINSIGNFFSQNPVVVFTDTLQYNAELVVVSQTGCTDTILHTINVHNNPIAGFVIIPEVAAPLQTITFNNNSSGANSYLWNFDDGQTSNYIEPTHTFADSGLYNVSLISTTIYGCEDSVFSSVRIVIPQYDIAVLDVSSKTTGSFIKVSTKIANFGSLPVDSVYLFLDMGNGVMIKEALNYHLLAGEIINYNFISQLEITPQNTTSYICVDALPPSTITDFAPANNHYCKALVDNFEVLPPYPSPVKNYIYIEFIIPAEGNVLISLLNSLGQKMKTLFNQHTNAGFNRYVYLAGEISNGAYYYQVEYNGKIKTRKFIKY